MNGSRSVGSSSGGGATIRRAADRGHIGRGWLDSWFSFSFAEYFDPDHMSFGPLRAINDDRVAAGRGFPMHSHQDMEILTVVLEGALEHKDSTGAHDVMKPGDVQRMSAGAGVTHSEFNPSPDEPVHFLQIWVLPNVRGIPAAYEQKHFPLDERRGRLRLVAGPEPGRDALLVHQDARVYRGSFHGAETATLEPRPGRRAYVHVAGGELGVNGERLSAGDALLTTGGDTLRFAQGAHADVLVFDLP